MDDYGTLLDTLGVENWTGDDATVTHENCGTTVEPDAHECPECGVPNPLLALGLI